MWNDVNMAKAFLCNRVANDLYFADKFSVFKTKLVAVLTSDGYLTYDQLQI